MLSTIKNTTNSSSKENENPLSKKWLEIEKRQKRNVNFQGKIDDLYKKFQDDILPEEQNVVALLAQETEHLVNFLPRKSFTQWQRAELQSWIENNLDQLASHPFANQELFQTTAQKYSDHLVKEAQNQNENVDFSMDEIEYMREMADDMFQGEKEFSEEELISFLRDPEIFRQKLHEFMAEKECDEEDAFDNEFEQQEDDFHQHNEQNHHQYQQYSHTSQQAVKEHKLKELFNTSKLNKLYKILASRLHPDKESNAHLKAEKSDLMAKLVKAKKNKDAFTIISLFHQFVPESEMSIFDGNNDEELSQALVKLLNEKLRELDEENRFNKYHNGLQSVVWQKFGGRSKKAIAENIKEHIADLENEQTRYQYSIDDITTVKLLKEVLSERYEQSRFNPFGIEGLSLDGIFGSNDF